MSHQTREAQGPANERFKPVREAADLLARAGQYQEAIGLLQQFVREWPEDDEAYEKLGLVHSLSGDPERGLDAFETAARLNPKSVSIRYNIGVSHRQSGRLLKAAESFAEATRLDENFYEGWINRAEILLRLGDSQAAREAAQIGSKMRSDDVRPWALLALAGLIGGSTSEVGEAVEGYRARGGRPASLFSELRDLIGDQRAIRLAKQLLARRATLAREAALFLGDHYYRQENADAAIACLLDARALGAEEAMTLIFLSRAYMLRGRTSEAETALRMATALEPESPAAWAERGNLLSELDKHAEAADSCRVASRLAPLDGRTWYNLGVALIRINRYEEAIHAYCQAVKLGPESSRASNNLGSIYLSLDREDEARQAYEDAIRYDRGNGRAWGNLGLELARRGDREGAIRHLREALRLRPERADLAITLIELESQAEP